MARPVPVWIVQDRESCLFLMPLNGDVGYTQFINEAGHFHCQEAAIETAVDCCGAGFVLFACYLDNPSF